MSRNRVLVKAFRKDKYNQWRRIFKAEQRFRQNKTNSDFLNQHRKIKFINKKVGHIIYVDYVMMCPIVFRRKKDEKIKDGWAEFSDFGRGLQQFLENCPQRNLREYTESAHFELLFRFLYSDGVSPVSLLNIFINCEGVLYPQS